MSTSSRQRPMVNKRYQPTVLLGAGSFGEVFLAEDTHTGEEVAIKFEKTRARHPQLLYESKIYNALAGGKGIPSAKWFGTERSNHILVTDRLGKSLEDLFTENNRKFDTLTTLLVGVQMIERIEYMHEKHFIHRDIKPDNFLCGRGKNISLIYVIDFGLSKRYRHPKTKKHNPYREGKNLTGTPRYASINNHLGVEQSRRDDLESIGYVLAYFCRGRLPWQGLRANTKKQKYQKIMDKKMAYPLDELCRDTPLCLKKFLEYSRTLRYDDKPNYGYLKALFNNTINDEYGNEDQVPFWARGKEVSGGRRKLKAREKQEEEHVPPPKNMDPSNAPISMYYHSAPRAAEYHNV